MQSNHFSFLSVCYAVANPLAEHFWADVENRKLFFEKFAKDRGFSSRDPSAWYFVKIKDLLQVKVGNLFCC